MLDPLFAQRPRPAAARALLSVALLLALLALALVPAGAAAQRATPLPEILPLPNGFQPEGIVAGLGTSYYVGSLATGAIYQGDFVTGQGAILVPPHEGRVAVGLAFDPRTGYLFVAGGPTGAVYIYDTATGADVADYQLAAPQTTFINDVIVTREAAYLTSSREATLYRLPLAPDGALPDPSDVETLPLPAEFATAPGVFGANGIEATANGRYLVVVHSALGALYRVDTQSGDVLALDLGGATVANGDGLLLRGRTLYVVQNRLNQIAVVRLNLRLGTGQVVGTLTDPDFRVPTTIAGFGGALYAVNARFGTPSTPDTEYEVVRVALR